MVNLVILACALRATTKKVVDFLGEGKKSAPPEKILVTSMSLAPFSSPLEACFNLRRFQGRYNRSKC